MVELETPCFPLRGSRLLSGTKGYVHLCKAACQEDFVDCLSPLAIFRVACSSHQDKDSKEETARHQRAKQDEQPYLEDVSPNSIIGTQRLHAGPI